MQAMQRDLRSDRPAHHMKRNASAALAVASSDAQLNQRFHDMDISAGASTGDEYAETVHQKRARHGSHHAAPALVTATPVSPSPASRGDANEVLSVADPDPDHVMTPALSRQAATETFIRRQLELRAIADARESSRIFNKLCRSMLQAPPEQSDDDEESAADPLPPVAMDS